MSICRPVAVVVFSAFIFAAPAFAGPEWIEQGDAGSKVGSAQRTFGDGNLNSIEGRLSTGLNFGADLEDMYLVTVTDPILFQMSVTANFDAQIYLFNITIPGEAFGLIANDNTIFGTDPVLTAMATDGTGAQVLVPGLYAVAIAGAGRSPISLNGNIFNFANPTEISGADGPGGLNPHLDWTGDGETGDYLIQMIGVGFSDLPEPGAIALLGIAGVRSLVAVVADIYSLISRR